MSVITSAVGDAASLVIIAVSFYGAIFSPEHIYAALILLIAGLIGLALRRRTHSHPAVSKIARYICVFSPSAAILILVAAVLSGFGRHVTRSDFGMFFASGLQLRIDAAHLYDVTAQNQMLELVTGGLKNHFLPFPYPPFVAALFVPFSYLSFQGAYYLMLIANLILLVATAWFLCKSLCKRRDQRIAVVLGGSVLLPIYINLILGQMAFVGLLLYSCFAVDVLEKRNGRAGLWTALLSYKLMLVPVPLFILLIRRAWKGVLVAGFVMALLFGFSFVLVGWEGMLANLHLLSLMTNESLTPRMQSMRGLTHYLGLPTGVFWMLVGLTLGGLWFVARRGGNLKWVLAAAMLANLLVSPYVQTYDLSLCLAALALAVSSLSEVPDSKRTAIQLFAFLPGFLAVVGQVTGKNWPAAPIAVMPLFCYCLYKACEHPAAGIPSDTSLGENCFYRGRPQSGKWNSS